MDRIKRTEAEHFDRKRWQSLKIIIPYLFTFRGRVLLALLCLIAAKAATVGVPVLLKAIVDHFSLGDASKIPDTMDAIVVLPVALLLGYGALRLMSSLFGELRDSVFARVRYHAMRSLSTRVLEHLHSLSLRFHLERKTGAISRDIERGTRSVGSILNFMVFSIIPIGVEFTLVAAILLVNYSPVFTLITFGTVIVYALFTFMISEWRMDHRLEMNRLDSQANNHAVDSLINYETVKYFNNESHEISRFDRTLGQWEEQAVTTQQSMSILNFGQSAVIALGVTFIMFFAADSVRNQNMTLGDLVMINAFMLQLFIPLGVLGMVYRQVKYSMADMDRIFHLLNTEPEIQDANEARDLRFKEGHIMVDNVSFAYQPERPILKNISFEIKPGQRVAIVGPSGSGKSTIARILFRFYELNQGTISIDGTDISRVTQQSLRKVMGIVPQDTVLFNETIYYNLQYGNPDATREQIVQAAKMAHIDEFIESLPDQWETLVGERGLKLSGGEKQRVAIARAILKNPGIMIFDEATSSLDSGTEQAIQQTLDGIATQHTTLIIAHRLSTIVDADQILVLRKGCIIERGTHESLLSQGGVYRSMWALQQSNE